jgi:hypothetical protein
MQRRERLPSRGICCPVEQHLDLCVVALRRVFGHPAAGLEVEILQIIARPLVASFGVQHFAYSSTLAATVDLGQILEEKSRTIE